MTERYDIALSDTVEVAQPAAETTGRLSKIRRIRQRLGRSTARFQVNSPNLPGAENSGLGVTTDLDHDTATEPDLEMPDDETETSEVALYKEELRRPTPKEQALLSGNITDVEPRGGGATYVKLDNGEAGLYWYNVNPKYHNERAAYLVDRAWKFDLVPTTVMRKFKDESGPTGEVSFQEYIPDATDARKIPDFESIEKFQADLYRLWILQYSIWHTDGHKGNVIVTDRIHAIDHAHAFWDDKKRDRGMFVNFYGVQAPEDVIKEADSFLKDDVQQQVLLEQLKELQYINNRNIQGYESDAEACLTRMRHIAKILTTKGKIDTEEELAEYLPS